jgi:hypothetical protein
MIQKPAPQNEGRAFFLPVFETQYSSHAVIWGLACAADQPQLATGFRTQDHLFAIRQLIVFNFLKNWRFLRKIYVN